MKAGRHRRGKRRSQGSSSSEKVSLAKEFGDDGEASADDLPSQASDTSRHAPFEDGHEAGVGLVQIALSPNGNADQICVDGAKGKDPQSVPTLSVEMPIDMPPLLEVGGSSAQTANLEAIQQFAIDILEKQYRSYVWNDGKVQALVTIDAGTIAGLLLVLQTFKSIDIVPFYMLCMSFLALLGGFAVCLIHAIPKLNARIGNERNLRTLIGITRLDKEAYHQAMAALSATEMLRMTCWQISGMSRNNLSSHRMIKKAAILTIMGVLALGVAIMLITVADWQNRHKESPPKDAFAERLVQSSEGASGAQKSKETPQATGEELQGKTGSPPKRQRPNK